MKALSIQTRHFLISLLHIIIFYALEVICLFVWCKVHTFPSPHSGRGKHPQQARLLH